MNKAIRLRLELIQKISSWVNSSVNPADFWMNIYPLSFFKTMLHFPLGFVLLMCIKSSLAAHFLPLASSIFQVFLSGILRALRILSSLSFSVSEKTNNKKPTSIFTNSWRKCAKKAGLEENRISLQDLDISAIILQLEQLRQKSWVPPWGSRKDNPRRSERELYHRISKKNPQN